MGKVKIKRKSTLIDMTAMSDVTVLLLTFFMLTSTFLQKEPATVITPSSVSEIKVPIENVASVLVSPAGNVFLGVTGEADPEVADGKWASDSIRREIINIAMKDYESKTGKKLGFESPLQRQKAIEQFSKMNMWGVPMESLPTFFSMKSEDRDAWMEGKVGPVDGKGRLKEIKTNEVGIPFKDITYEDKDGNKIITNEFQIWMRAIYNCGNDNLQSAMKKGEGIAVKADRGTKYDIVHKVLDNLQTIKMNRFSVMTALKTENDD